MTRRVSVRQNVLAARSSFWESPLQDTDKTEVRRRVSEPLLPDLYDQLTHLKDWKEETAELCSAAEAREPSAGRATRVHEALPRCSREDSAMRLSSATRPSLSSSTRSASTSSVSARTSSSSSQGIRHSRERRFCRSSFSAARPYETRRRRQRPRTFAMEEVDASTCFAVYLEEVISIPMAADNQQAGRRTQNRLFGMAVSSLTAADDMLRSVMKSALYQTTGHTQGAS